jgi:hypothetical protein
MIPTTPSELAARTDAARAEYTAAMAAELRAADARRAAAIVATNARAIAPMPEWRRRALAGQLPVRDDSGAIRAENGGR